MMRVDTFDFQLPDEQIAVRPVEPRDSSRMLVITPHNEDQLSDFHAFDLPSLLKAGDALVFNDTSVIPAHLEGRRSREKNGELLEVDISVTLHLREAIDQWRVFAKPAKRLKINDKVSFYKNKSVSNAPLVATVSDKGEDGSVLLTFEKSGADLDLAIIETGKIPLPPYIASKRAQDGRDVEDYQTIYAREKGAVAAPTAGLHFTKELFDALEKKKIEHHFVTLHVGAGTFLPVKVDDTDDHLMHSEIGEVSQQTADALNRVREQGGRIVSVGTTSLRLLESATNDDGKLLPWRGKTGIFITPGYRFKFVDILMTNFHLPKSTLFMLVSAFCGLKTMRSAYDYAIKTGYRFYSYGDTSLLFKNDGENLND